MMDRGRDILWVAVLGVSALVWVFWPTLVEYEERWSSDPQYSHCYLVPLFSVWLLWARRTWRPASTPWPHWTGLLLLVAGFSLRMVGSLLFQQTIEGIGLLACLLGLAWFLLGPSGARWALPAIGFLIFLIPLPYRVQVMLGTPLQRVATVSSTYLLQTLGIAAVPDGNVIHLDNSHIGIVEACNGLGMLVSFFAVSTAVALCLRKPFLDRVLVILSAVPIALFVNILRITMTGIMTVVSGPELAHKLYHDLAGWFMMPLALILVFVFIAFLNQFVLSGDAEREVPLQETVLATALRHQPA